MSRVVSLSVPALKIRQPIGEFFVCVFSARALIEISWVDVRRMSGEGGEIDDYLGIQRRISESRVKNLRRYVQTADATFPSSIIVAIPGRCAKWDEKANILRIAEFIDEDEPSRNVPFDRIAKILDGQHRIRGLAQADGDQFSFDMGQESPFDLNVAVFVEADIAEQAAIFSTVNLAQTKVNKSLVYDLFSLSESRSPQKTAHTIAVALNKTKGSPFFRSIKRLGTATPGIGDFEEYVTQASFVEGLLPHISRDPVEDRDFFMRNLRKRLPYPSKEELSRHVFRGLFVEEKEGEIARIVWSYFGAISDVWPNSWGADHQGNIIRRTNGFRAFMSLIKDYYLAALDGREVGSPVDRVEFKRLLSFVEIEDGAFTSEVFPPGSSGESALKRLLREGLVKAKSG